MASALSWLRQGREAAVATVAQTWGSAPCPAGSCLWVREDGHFLGSVSGGCIEGDVITRALEFLCGSDGEDDEAARAGFLLDYKVADERAWEVGLSCGGKMRVYVEPVAAEMETLLEDGARRRPVARLVDLEKGGWHLFRPQADTPDTVWKRIGHAAWQKRQSGIWEMEGERWFAHLHLPKVRLVIVGATHIAQHLCAFGLRLGYEVIVADSRESFATEERFPQATLLRQWPEDALASLELDARCAVVALTHDPKLDDPALRAALQRPCFYIAALGSRKNHESRRERLRKHGVEAAEVARIHGPAGLDIGARAPEEIALSILAQLVACLQADAVETA